MVAPRIAGGDAEEARVHAEEIFRRDEARGHFARGYIAYRGKEYGVGRRELRASIAKTSDPLRRGVAMRWLGWLSQESQQWDEAFAIFEELGEPYEVARTAAFCRCRLERGRAALEQHLKSNPENRKEALKLREQLRKLR